MSKRDELRAKIQSGSKRSFAEVETPDGETYLIRSLNLREKGENESLLINSKGSIDTSKMNRQKCDLLCRSVVEPDSKEPVFEVSEWQVWESVDAAITSKLLAEIESLNEGREVAGLVGN